MCSGHSTLIWGDPDVALLVLWCLAVRADVLTTASVRDRFLRVPPFLALTLRPLFPPVVVPSPPVTESITIFASCAPQRVHDGQKKATNATNSTGKFREGAEGEECASWRRREDDGEGSWAQQRQGQTPSSEMCSAVSAGASSLTCCSRLCTLLESPLVSGPGDSTGGCVSSSGRGAGASGSPSVSSFFPAKEGCRGTENSSSSTSASPQIASRCIPRADKLFSFNKECPPPIATRGRRFMPLHAVCVRACVRAFV